jgi:hypothetical protein
MKLLWQRVMPLIRCWRVLVPLKMATDFENVCSKLERLMLVPEPISQHPYQGATHDGVPDAVQGWRSVSVSTAMNVIG